MPVLSLLLLICVLIKCCTWYSDLMNIELDSRETITNIRGIIED